MAEPAAIEVIKREERIVPAKITPVILTDRDIAIISQNIAMAEKLVMTVLEESIDYGQIPGIAGKGLWDPGASKIMNGFQCYPQHRVLHHEEGDEIISWAIEAVIIHRESQQVIGTGVGACSTREPKYKYRWVPDPESYGYTKAEIKQLKTRKHEKATHYRIENPEYGEQVNTILKMAAKRAEVDAAQTLPGVSSALRKLFDTRQQQGPRWTTFWNQTKALNLTEADVRKMLGVASMKDWISSGRSLDEAIKTLAERIAARAAEEPPEDTSEPKQVTRDPLTVKTIGDLFQACLDDWGLQPAGILAELNVSSKDEITDTPSECYQKIASVR